jgi:hypothetical protein
VKSLQKQVEDQAAVIRDLQAALEAACADNTPVDAAVRSRFLHAREAEAEGLFGCVVPLLTEAAQLVKLIDIRLAADHDAFALSEVAAFATKRGVPVKVPVGTLRFADALAQFHRECDPDDGGSWDTTVPDDAVVVDRSSLGAAVATTHQSLMDARIRVANALSSYAGNECNMQ